MIDVGLFWGGLKALAVSFTNEGAENQALDALENWVRTKYSSQQFPVFENKFESFLPLRSRLRLLYRVFLCVLVEPR